jgi:hypothetical protein
VGNEGRLCSIKLQPAASADRSREHAVPLTSQTLTWSKPAQFFVRIRERDSVLRLRIRLRPRSRWETIQGH